MAPLRRLDAFVKPREDLRTRSAVGGLITVIAAFCASILFLSQVYLYFVGTTRHSLHISESTSKPVPLLSMAKLAFYSRESIPLNVHVTFPHVKCQALDISLDGASLHDGQVEKLQVTRAIQMTVPTETDLYRALGRNAILPRNKAEGCTVKGTLRIDKVGGTFSITVSNQAWMEATSFAMQMRMSNMPDQVMKKMYNVRYVSM